MDRFVSFLLAVISFPVQTYPTIGCSLRLTPVVFFDTVKRVVWLAEE